MQVHAKMKLTWVRRQFRHHRMLCLLICWMMITQAFSQSVPMKISALSDNHVLVSLTPEQRYLLLPIEEDEAQAALKVIVDNEVVETLNVKLAADHVDYSVPLDLGRYTNKPVLLDVTSDVLQAMSRTLRLGKLCKVRHILTRQTAKNIVLSIITPHSGAG